MPLVVATAFRILKSTALLETALPLHFGRQRPGTVTNAGIESAYLFHGVMTSPRRVVMEAVGFENSEVEERQCASGLSSGTWRRRVCWGTIATILLLSIVGSLLADRVSEWVGHGLGHAVVALPVGALAVLARRSWPPPSALAPGRLARSIVVLGFGGLATGQLLEVLGARVDEPNAHAIEEIAHTAGQIVTILSMPLLLVGMVLTGIAGARAGVVPRWLVALGSLIALGLVLFMLLGGPIR